MATTPKIRFKGFTDDWEQRKLSEVLEIVNNKNGDSYGKEDVLSVSDEYGCINQIRFQGRSFAGEDISNYKIVDTGDIIYTRSPLKSKPYGIIKVVGAETGIVSPLYIVNKAKAGALKTAADAKALKFAVEAGSAGEAAAKDNGYKATAVETQAAAVMEVAAGTSEACIIDSLMAAAMVGPGTSYPDLTYTVALTEEEYGVGFRKGSDLVPAINDFFKKAYADGSMMKAAEKYGTQASIIPQK